MAPIDILTGVGAVVAAVLGVERLVRLFTADRYVKLDELRQLKDSLATDRVLAGAENTRAHHRIDVLLEGLKNLPGFAQINDVKEDIVQLKQSVAINTTKLQGISEDVHEIKVVIDRLGEELRKNGR